MEICMIWNLVRTFIQDFSLDENSCTSSSRMINFKLSNGHSHCPHASVSIEDDQYVDYGLASLIGSPCNMEDLGGREGSQILSCKPPLELGMWFSLSFDHFALCCTFVLGCSRKQSGFLKKTWRCLVFRWKTPLPLVRQIPSSLIVNFILTFLWTSKTELASNSIVDDQILVSEQPSQEVSMSSSGAVRGSSTR